eukprot:766618-Prymnesium_polylepis.2
MADKLRQTLVAFASTFAAAPLGATVASVSRVPCNALRKQQRKAGVSYAVRAAPNALAWQMCTLVPRVPPGAERTRKRTLACPTAHLCGRCAPNRARARATSRLPPCPLPPSPRGCVHQLLSDPDSKWLSRLKCTPDGAASVSIVQMATGVVAASFARSEPPTLVQQAPCALAGGCVCKVARGRALRAQGARQLTRTRSSPGEQSPQGPQRQGRRAARRRQHGAAARAALDARRDAGDALRSGASARRLGRPARGRTARRVRGVVCGGGERAAAPAAGRGSGGGLGGACCRQATATAAARAA